MLLVAFLLAMLAAIVGASAFVKGAIGDATTVWDMRDERYALGLPGE